MLWVGGTGRGPIRTFPSHITPYAVPDTVIPTHITPYAVPDTAIPVPHHVIPNHITSFPRRRESSVLHPTPYSQEYPSPPKVIPSVMFSSGSNPLRLDQ